MRTKEVIFEKVNEKIDRGDDVLCTLLTYTLEVLVDIRNKMDEMMKQGILCINVERKDYED